MILEVAPLQVKPGQASEFEAAFLQAQRIISSMPGYVSHDLQRCIERPNEYSSGQPIPNNCHLESSMEDSLKAGSPPDFLVVYS